MKIHHYLDNTATTSHGATGKQLLKYGADVKIKQDMRIKLQETEYWLLADSLDEDGAIAPLDHCDENGNIVEFLELSYAHYYPERGVLRFGNKIADREDIEIIK